MLFTPTTLRVTSNNSTSNFPLGLILGPGLTALNAGMAGSANKHFKEELKKYNLADREIAPGETVYGLVGIQSQAISPLYIRFTDR